MNLLTHATNLLVSSIGIFLALSPVALLGIPYRTYQAVTGTLRARLKATHGIRQISGALGITLVFVNVAILMYTLGFLIYHLWTAPNYVGLWSFGLGLLLGLCGVSYAVMESFLVSLPPLPSLQPLRYILRGSLFGTVALFVVLSTVWMLSLTEPRSGRYLRMILPNHGGPLPFLALWFASGLILNVGASLIAAKRPLYFALSAIAMAALYGLMLDFLLRMDGLFFTPLLSIAVSASAATVIFLNRQSPKD